MARTKSQAVKWRRRPRRLRQDAPPPPEQPLPPPGSVRLFKKKLDSRDANPVLGQLVIEECWGEMKTALEKLVAEKSHYCLRVLVNGHELHFMKYFGGRYALFNAWGDVVSRNKLREGDIVDCFGYFSGNDEIHATLMVNPSERNSSPENPQEMEIESPEEVRLKSLQFKHLLKIPEAVVETPAAVDFLFEKKLDYGDVDPDLDHLVFTRCGKRLKAALDETPSIRVSMVDPNNNVKHTSLLFKRYIIGEMYALRPKWGLIVAENGLKEGDTVEGYGNDVGGGGREFTLRLYIVRDEDEPPTSDAKREKRRRSDEGLKMEEERNKEKRQKMEEDAATPPPPIPKALLFKKKLNRSDIDIATVSDQCRLLVIEEYHEEMKTLLDKLMEVGEYFCLRIIADDDLLEVQYELRFANHAAENYAVFFDQWDSFVTFLKPREGDTVECWGYYVGKDEFRATLRIEREMPEVVNQPPENPEEKEQELPEILEEVTAAENIETPVEGETAVTDQEPEGQILVENRGPESEPGVGEKGTGEPGGCGKV